MTLNSQLSEKQAIEQLNNARAEITNLQNKINELYNALMSYQNTEKKVPFDVEMLYYQLRFLHSAHEVRGELIIKNNKIVRIESKGL